MNLRITGKRTHVKKSESHSEKVEAETSGESSKVRERAHSACRKEARRNNYYQHCCQVAAAATLILIAFVACANLHANDDAIARFARTRIGATMR